MMASLLQMNTASTSGSGTLPGNTITNPKGELKAITTRSGLVTEGPTVPNPPKPVNPEEDECVEETYTTRRVNLKPLLLAVDLLLKDLPFPILPNPLIQRRRTRTQIMQSTTSRDSLLPHIPYPLRMLKQKQQEKDEFQIHKFWKMFKQLHINITLADALILILKYQKMLKDILSNKEKLLELENTPLNEIAQRLSLRSYPRNLETLGNFSFRMVLVSSSARPSQSRDVFISVGKFTFPVDFVIVDYESDPRVPIILGRPFLRTVHALIDVHGEEIILRDGDERLT
nr:hypothetical protein [Tanacetum cinerariifolium]